MQRANKRFARDLVNLTVTKPYKHPDVEEERKSSLYILRSRRDGGERTKHKDCFARGDVMEYIQGEREILELSFHSEREERERNFRALVSLWERRERDKKERRKERERALVSLWEKTERKEREREEKIIIIKKKDRAWYFSNIAGNCYEAIINAPPSPRYLFQKRNLRETNAIHFFRKILFFV